jgi:hypothetical protein
VLYFSYPLGCLNLQGYTRMVHLLKQIKLISAGTGDPRQVVRFDILDANGVQCVR